MAEVPGAPEAARRPAAIRPGIPPGLMVKTWAAAGILAACGLGMMAVLAPVAYGLQGLAGLRGLGVSGALTLIPGAAVLAVSLQAPPSSRVWFALVGGLVRTGVALGGWMGLRGSGWSAVEVIPWLLVLYMGVLAVETWIMSRRLSGSVQGPETLGGVSR